MPDLPWKQALLVGLAVGLLVGVVVLPAVGEALDARSEPVDPAHSVSSAGPSCHDSDVDDEAWLHVVATGETWTVTLAATVVHPPGTVVEADVRRRSGDRFEIALDAVEPSEDRPRGDSATEDCRAETTLRLATGLSQPTVDVTANGRTVRSIDQQSTFGRLYELPAPIDAES